MKPFLQHEERSSFIYERLALQRKFKYDFFYHNRNYRITGLKNKYLNGKILKKKTYTPYVWPNYGIDIEPE